MMNILPVTSFLLSLREAFQKDGFDIRDVGGSVRDALIGLAPKDRDFCTDADPDRQIAIYKAHGFRFVETGLQHGTITVVDPDTGEGFEITSLRLESDHDGRHATVTYTNDWVADLGRRDLTINAMAMDFDGNLYDPFGGQSDLQNGVVRFVGDAGRRIREDYLRILRYFRFLGRFGKSVDLTTMQEIQGHVDGLKRISVERVWSELRRIIVGPNSDLLVPLMFHSTVSQVIGMTAATASIVSENPITQLVANEGQNAVTLTQAWKMSVDEKWLAYYLIAHRDGETDYESHLAVGGVSRDWVIELAKLKGHVDRVSHLTSWNIPVFPVSGADLIARGFAPGPQFGMILKDAMNRWAQSRFRLNRDELLETI